MKKLIITIAATVTLTNAYSQPNLLWSKNFETAITNPYASTPTIESDNNTIKVTGIKNITDGQELLIVNYNLSGDTISTSRYGDNSGKKNTIFDYKFDTKDHVYILSEEETGPYMTRMNLLKYALDGKLIWSTQFEDPDSSFEPNALALINDTCLFITANKELETGDPDDDVNSVIIEPFLYACNTEGKQLWQRKFDPHNEIEWFRFRNQEILVLNNTAYMFGNNQAASSIDLIKVDVNNVMTVNNNTGIKHGVYGILLTPDNNLLVKDAISYTFSKVGLDGNVLWKVYYGTNLPSNVSGDEIKAMIQDEKGNIYLTGRHYGSNTNADILTLKYDKDGKLIWQNRYQYKTNNGDIGNSITLKNGSVYVGGESEVNEVPTTYDYVILKIDETTGDTKGSYRYGGSANGNDLVYSLAVLDNGNVALTGFSYTNPAYDWTTQLLSDVLSVREFDHDVKIDVFPNPVKQGQFLTIQGNETQEYTLTTLLGQVIGTGIINGNNNHITTSSVRPGMYLLTLRNSKGVTTRKIIVE
jgi:hypothetical protein